jgi:ArsR family transcriptional regulator
VSTSDSAQACRDHGVAASRLSRAELERASAIFRAAGDPERLAILEALARGETCVSELATYAGAGMSTVSQRLRLLRDEGLVARRRDGRHIYDSLASDHVAALIETALEHARH